VQAGKFENTSPLIKLLVERRADPMDCGRKGARDSILHLLCRPELGTQGIINNVHHLLNALTTLGTGSGSVVVTMLQHQNAAGLSPLHYSIQTGNIAAMSALVSLIGQVCVRPPNSTDGNTPLHTAIAAGRVAVLSALLGSTNMTVSNAGNTTANSRAALKALEAITSANTPNNEGLTPLMMATAENNTAMMELLLKHSSAGVNAPGLDGNTPLHVGIRKRAQAAVQLLLQHGARVNQPDNSGITPFMAAVLGGNAAALAEMCRTPSAALAMNAPSSSSGMTAMHEAAGQAGGHLLIEAMAENGGAGMPADVCTPVLAVLAGCMLYLAGCSGACAPC
jgi:ankyrin repeat protein